MSKLSSVIALLIGALIGLGGFYYFSFSPVSMSTNYEIIDRVKQNKLDALESHFSSLIAKYHDDPTTEIKLSRQFDSFANSDPLFEPRLKSWLEKYPDSIAAKLALAELYLHLGWLSRGTQYISKTHDNQIAAMNQYFEKASQLYLDVLKQDPELILPYHGILSIVKTMRNPSLEAMVTQKAMAVHPESYLFQYQRLFALQPKWGGSLEAIDEAIKELEPYFSKNPELELVKAFQAIAIASEIVRRKKGDESCTTALSYINKALEKYRTAQLYDNQGRYHRCLSEYDKAIEAYTQAIVLQPSTPDYFIGRARNYNSVEKYDEAIADINQALHFDTLNPRALRTMGWAYYKQKRYDEAKQAYEKSLIYGEYVHRAHRMLGYIYFNSTKDYVSAEKSFLKAKEYGDKNPRTTIMLASAQYRQQDCKYIPTAEEYLAMCEKNRKCADKYTKWAKNSIKHSRSDGTCPQ